MNYPYESTSNNEWEQKYSIVGSFFLFWVSASVSLFDKDHPASASRLYFSTYTSLRSHWKKWETSKAQDWPIEGNWVPTEMLQILCRWLTKPTLFNLWRNNMRICISPGIAWLCPIKAEMSCESEPLWSLAGGWGQCPGFCCKILR